MVDSRANYSHVATTKNKAIEHLPLSSNIIISKQAQPQFDFISVD